MSDSNSTPIVAPDTDDLEAFEDLLHGRAVEPEDETPDGEDDDQEVETDDADTDEDVEDDSLAEDDDEEEEADEPAPKKTRLQKRIDDLVAEAKTEKRERIALQAKLDQLTAALPNKDSTPAPKDTADEPKPDDKSDNGEDKYPLGEFDPKYIRDLTRFTIKQETDAAETARKTKDVEDSNKEAADKLATEWQTKLAARSEDFVDMAETNAALEDTFRDLEPAYGEYLATTIMQMDFGPDVLYYLGQNIDEAKQIAAKGPAGATIALGRLEAKFANADAPPSKKVSSAPTPPPTNKGTSARKAVSDDTDDLTAFEAKFYKKR